MAPEQRIHIGGSVTGQMLVGDHIVVFGTGGSSASANAAPPLKVRRRTRPKRQAPPRRDGEMLGRDAALARVGEWLDEGAAVQVYGVPGVGKSALLKAVAVQRIAAGNNVIFLSAAGLAVEDVIQELFQACYDVEDYRPDRARLRRLMGTVQALVVVDDFDGPPEDLTVFLDSLPAADLLVASVERSLFSAGQALELRGLAEEAALALLARELGSEVDDEVTARSLCRAASRRPRVLLQAAAAMRGESTPSDQPRIHLQALVDGLDTGSRKALEVLHALDGIVVSTGILSVLTDVSGEALTGLADARLVSSDEHGYVLVAELEALELPAQVNAADFAEPLTGWAGTSTVQEVAGQAALIVRVLTGAVHRHDDRAACDLAQAAAPKLRRALRWGAWREVLALGRQAAGRLSARDDEAYFTQEEQVRRRASFRAVHPSGCRTTMGFLPRSFAVPRDFK